MLLTKVHKVLLGLLAVQVVITVFVWTRGNRNAVVTETQILAGYDAAKVTRVQIFAAGDKPGVDLAKRGADWVLASGFDYPVDAKKVNDLLTPIAKMSAAEPIATSSSRHKQLRVGDSDFERKLVLSADGKDTTIYIGSSAGLRRTAIRIGGSDDVYAVGGVSPYLAGSEASSWVATRYLDVQADAIRSVTVTHADGSTLQLAHESLAKTPPAPGSGSGSGSGAGSGSGSAAVPPPPPSTSSAIWDAAINGTPVALEKGEILENSEIERLVNSVAGIDMAAPADPKRDASHPTATITIVKKSDDKGATPKPIELDVILDGQRYWLRERGNAKAIYVDKIRIDDLVTATRDKIVKKPPPPAPAPGAGSGSGSGSAATPPAPIAPGPAMPVPKPPTR